MSQDRQVDLYLAWEQALNDSKIDVALVASLETEAAEFGIDLRRINTVLLNGMTAAVGGWNPDLHPRGRDGQFIEKLGIVNLFDFKKSRTGKRIPEARGTVKEIKPTRRKGQPDIVVELDDGSTVTVKPNQVSSGPNIKARLLAPDARSLQEFEGRSDPDAEVARARFQLDRILDQPSNTPEAEALKEEIRERLGREDGGLSDEQVMNYRAAIQEAELGDRSQSKADDEMLEDFGQGVPTSTQDQYLSYSEAEQAQGNTPLDLADWLMEGGPEGEDSGTNQIGELLTSEPGELGSKTNPIKTSDPLEAVEALYAGQYVELESIHQVSTLLDELGRIANEAKAAGDEAPNYDLCLVTVPGTNLFCVESKGIPRIQMPQLGGIPTAGSKADSLPKNANGEVDIGPAFIDHLRSKGVLVEEKRRMASHLKASQSELSGPKVAQMMQWMESGDEKALSSIRESAIFSTKDDYVIDGHHRWASVVGLDAMEGPLDELDMPVREIDMEILDVLREANEFAIAMGVPSQAVTV